MTTKASRRAVLAGIGTTLPAVAAAAPAFASLPGEDADLL